jgi:hypothetical protein
VVRHYESWTFEWADGARAVLYANFLGMLSGEIEQNGLGDRLFRKQESCLLGGSPPLPHPMGRMPEGCEERELARWKGTEMGIVGQVTLPFAHGLAWP